MRDPEVGTEGSYKTPTDPQVGTEKTPRDPEVGTEGTEKTLRIFFFTIVQVMDMFMDIMSSVIFPF